MLLAMDVGNTNIVLGVYEGEKLRADFRVATNLRGMADDYGVLITNLLEKQNLKPEGIKAIVICSVVPPLTKPLEDMSKKYFKLRPMIVGTSIEAKIKILYDNPEEVGADRIVNAFAASLLYECPVIIVDFGTATTFDVISKDGDYLGGAITPGISISLEALFQRAAKLPRINIVKPKRVIGKNTVESMQSGVVFGYVSQVDGIVQRIKEELSSEAYVVATGGLAELIAQESKTIKEVNLNLTLEGLRMIYERRKGK